MQCVPFSRCTWRWWLSKWEQNKKLDQKYAEVVFVPRKRKPMRLDSFPLRVTQSSAETAILHPNPIKLLKPAIIV